MLNFKNVKHHEYGMDPAQISLSYTLIYIDHDRDLRFLINHPDFVIRKHEFMPYNPHKSSLAHALVHDGVPLC